MRIIITETQKELLDYNRLSPCIKRRLDLPRIDEMISTYVMSAIRYESNKSNVVNVVIDSIYSNISDYIEVCWGDESYYQFSTNVKRFLTSRYENQINNEFEEFY